MHIHLKIESIKAPGPRRRLSFATRSERGRGPALRSSWSIRSHDRIGAGEVRNSPVILRLFVRLGKEKNLLRFKDRL